MVFGLDMRFLGGNQQKKLQLQQKTIDQSPRYSSLLRPSAGCDRGVMGDVPETRLYGQYKIISGLPVIRERLSGHGIADGLHCADLALPTWQVARLKLCCQG
jgi:hypothetical protein